MSHHNESASQPAAPTPSPDEPALGKTPLGLKIFGVLCILGGIILIPEVVLGVLTAWTAFRENGIGSDATITVVLYGVFVVCVAVTVFSYVFFGVRLLRNKRRRARLTAEWIIIFLIIDLLCSLMLFGVRQNLLIFIVNAVILVATHTYIDPSLSEERELQRKLRDMETREEAEEGTLGLDKTGEGFIQLDFFNLFWIFVIACVLGDAIETVYHFAVVVPGEYQVRAGMLWGPFSPIYGFGAVLMTLALNRFHKANVIIIFLVSAVIGGAFEYLVSWFLQFAFGVVAWDYTGTFLSIGGRTNFMFMCMWGALGVVWIKAFLPVMLRIVNLIPWQWRYTITTVCATLMIVDGAMTLIALDCWYSSIAGLPDNKAIKQFCGEHFDNQWMADRFQ
ncbi:MAG: putative ABC transporter permease, partial [Eggerthellaceae bacterium]|nr:putative ABC transporter permease [Eggerthellaceae bacterium]